MFCGKCGANLPEDAKFCSSCGNAIESVSADTTLPITEEPVVSRNLLQQSHAYTAAPSTETYTKPKKKGSKRGWIALLVAVVTVAFVAVFFGNSIINHLKLAVMDPTEYYASVEYQNIEAFLNALDKKAVDPQNYQCTGEISLKVTEELLDILEDIGLEWDYDMRELAVALSAQVNVKDDKIQANLGGKINSKEIISGETILDLAKEEVYVQIPLFSDKAFAVDMRDLDLDLPDTLPERKISEESLSLLKTYAKILLENSPEFEKSKDELNVNGVTASYTLLRTEMTAEDLANMLIPVLKELKRDDKAVAFICGDFAEAMTGDTWDEDYFIDRIDALIDTMEYDMVDVDLFEYKVWVDDDGKIMGREIKTEEITAGIYNARNGGKQGTEILVKSNGMKVVFSGTAKRSGDELKNGAYTLEVFGLEMATVELKKFNVEKPQKGEFEAEFSVSLSQDALDLMDLSGMTASLVEDMSVNFKIESESKSGKFVMALNSDDKALLEIDLSGESGDGEKISVSKSVVDVEDYADEIDDIADILDELMDKLEKAGIDSELVEDLYDYIVEYSYTSPGDYYIDNDKMTAWVDW